MADPVTVTVAAAGAVVTLGTAAGMGVVGARRIAAKWRRVADFLGDWNGEPGRPGVQPRSGVMQRLEDLEAGMVTIRGEVTPNGGGSLKDLVRRIDARTSADGELLAEHITWHRNAGAVDPTARVLLARPEHETRDT